MIYEGYQFYVKRTITKGDGSQTQYLSCSKHRSGCPAKLIVSSDGRATFKNEHTCAPPVKPAVDATEEMKKNLETCSQTDLSRAPGRVWDEVYEELKTKYEGHPFKVLSRQQGVQHVNYVRSVVNGGDFFRTIETEPHCFISQEDERFFLLFNSTFVSKNVLQRICGFAHPELIMIMRHPGLALYIDGTFKICPSPFKQVVIIMAYDAGLDVYTPVVYVLATAKCEKTYTNIMYWVQAAINFRLKPRTVTCDFERALISAVTSAFPTSAIVGCLFHWKQALRRKLIDLRIPRDDVKRVMEEGVMDVLTVIPISAIVSDGIPYVRSKVNEKGHKKAWNTFWAYFVQTWMKNYEASWWNVSEMMLSQEDIRNRTNNPVESYNYQYQRCFENGSPNPYVWLQVTKKEAIRVWAMREQVRKNVRDPPAHRIVADPRIPDDYPLDD